MNQRRLEAVIEDGDYQSFLAWGRLLPRRPQEHAQAEVKTVVARLDQ